MDVSSSALASTLRVGVNILVNQRRPVLEFYSEVHNKMGPPFDPNIAKGALRSYRTADQFIAFTLINTGSARAENVMLTAGGDFKRPLQREWGPRFGVE